jgi:phospholipase/carboxylesterase
LPKLRGKRVFMAAGKTDRLIPPRESEHLASLLEEAGAAVTLFWQPGGHGLSRAEVEAAAEWLGEVETWS